jgi:hypothetical protein
MHMPFPFPSYDRLQQCYRKSIRTGTWRRLHHLDKALFRASLDYLQRGGRILNEALLEKLSRLMALLTETRGTRIVRRGLAKAAALLRDGAEKGLFGWVPQLKYWLQDPEYIYGWGGVGNARGRKYF